MHNQDTMMLQVQLVKRIAKLLKPTKGTMIAGRQVGNAQPGHYDAASGGTMYQHNEQSFKEMWCKNVAGEWKVEASLNPFPGRGQNDGPPPMRIVFFAERI
eukprot:Phypoly_transcript_12141.p3 GENE.Phypoly_transcript_12141~~Phypoly_transcript_12141.p3  ORF type:complete len:101 (+),score=18.31 Phypoly_transcript_12141:779-1081(+)